MVVGNVNEEETAGLDEIKPDEVIQSIIFTLNDIRFGRMLCSVILDNPDDRKS